MSGIKWQSGQTLDDLYVINAIFEGGGMGIVYRVWHLGWEMDLALKHPRQELISDPDTVALFERECEAWVGIGLHPHIATCHYVKTISHLPCVFAEFVEGGSLRDWISTKRLYKGEEPAVLARIIGIAIQFAWGLDWAHQHGLIHQDVKPGNVLMTADGLVKVTDFGLAKAAKTFSPISGSAEVSVGGMTPGYCSPEQAANKSLTVATDVWSWAVSVMEMFMGGINWHSGPVAAASLDSYGQCGRRLRGAPEMPIQIFELLRMCLHRDPSRRPPRFRKIAHLLIGFYQEIFGEEFELEEPDVQFLVPDALNNRAVALADLGRAEEAINLLEKALAADSEHSQALFNFNLLQSNPNQKNGLCLCVPRSGADYSYSARRFKRLMEKARLASQRGMWADTRRYLNTAQELPGFERHPALRTALAMVQQ